MFSLFKKKETNPEPDELPREQVLQNYQKKFDELIKIKDKSIKEVKDLKYLKDSIDKIKAAIEQLGKYKLKAISANFV